jgi:hypothetical protein
MTAIWEPIETLTTKRSRSQRERLERFLEWGGTFHRVAKLDNGIIIDVSTIIRRSNYGSFFHRTKVGEIHRTELADCLGMGIKEFRVFRQNFDTTFPNPSRVIDNGYGQPILFWDVEEVLEWADSHQTT